MNVGSICYPCHSGLGHLGRDFFRAGVINRVLLTPHPTYKNHDNFYPREATYAKGDWKRFLEGLDVLLLFETALHGTWYVLERARDQKIKIVLMPMYEWSAFRPPVEPDLWLCPSLLDVDYYKDRPHALVTVPVDRTWKLRERAKGFVHNAGHGQRQWTKGTLEVIEAFKHTMTDARLLLRLQPDEQRTRELYRRLRGGEGGSKITLHYGEVADEELYREGDVFINAEQYNGLSLPLQEAWASGMAVMTTDRYPANTWLPKELLLPVKRIYKDKIAVELDRCEVDPLEIAKKVDAWYDRDIRDLSERGREWAEQNSWEVWKPKYLNILQGI